MFVLTESRFGACLLMSLLLAAAPLSAFASADLPLGQREPLTGNWRGVRDDLAGHGIHFDASLIAEGSYNVRGGIDRGFAYQQLLEVGLELETQPLLGLAGGRFGMLFQDRSGKSAVTDLVGDSQGFSNIDEPMSFSQLAELWYEQQWLNDQLRLKVGKMDANKAFAFVDHGMTFIHSSAGYSPTIVGFPTYPDPAMGVEVFAYPHQRVYAGLGLYDGAAAQGISTGSRGPSTFFRSTGGWFMVGELGLTWQLGADQLAGRVGVGGWGHTGHFDRFDGARARGTQGAYLVMDQLIHAHDPGDDESGGIGVFAQYGWADRQISEFQHHLGAGVQWDGPLPPRPSDALGFMASYVHLSSLAGFDRSYEWALETYYYIQALPWLGVQLDMQVIVHPGGRADEQSNAVVGTLRFIMDF